MNERREAWHRLNQSVDAFHRPACQLLPPPDVSSSLPGFAGDEFPRSPRRHLRAALSLDTRKCRVSLFRVRGCS
ncbi:hypothetical protein NDU88_008647 [Pleurodeles waltl]|uniref:Uncharacterized protein n=1 Tax=Pleurodeles waltl TaxID=8319 RepID=A0AAV7QP85_PLEWA|nr:hypothetical protein NDU88_008647 [Pleurodeles waltl]